MPGRQFHPGRTATKPKPWYEREGGARLARDRALVAARYPCLTHRIDAAARLVFLEGAITLIGECGVRSPISTRIEFADDYPAREPRAYDAAGRFPHDADHHFYSNGRCCLWLPPESRWDPFDPDALPIFLDEVAIFFDRQLVHEVTGDGSWPGGQRAHGYRGYLEFVADLLGGDRHLLAVLVPILANASGISRNSSCPCGSGRKYKRCHLATVEDIQRRVGPAEVRKIFRGALERNENNGKLGDPPGAHTQRSSE